MARSESVFELNVAQQVEEGGRGITWRDGCIKAPSGSFARSEMFENINDAVASLRGEYPFLGFKGIVGPVHRQMPLVPIRHASGLHDCCGLSASINDKGEAAEILADRHFGESIIFIFPSFVNDHVG